MAGLACSSSSGAVSIAANTVKTAIQLIAPTNQRLTMRRISVSFEGATSTAKPARVRFLRQTTAGTVSSGTAAREGAGSETPQATIGINASAEPTASDVLWEQYVPVYQGLAVLPIDVLWGYELPGGTRLGVDILTASAEATVNARVTMEWVE